MEKYSTRELQRKICTDKEKSEFVSGNLLNEFCSLYCKVKEAYETNRDTKNLDEIAGKLVDVVLITLKIAELKEIDLGAAIGAAVDKESNRIITIEDVIHAVAEEYKISKNEMVSIRRDEPFKSARIIAAYISHEYLGMTLSSIATRLRRDFSTVLYMITIVKKKEDKVMGKEIEKIVNHLGLKKQ